MAVDERTNSLLFLADDQKACELEVSYTLLDSESQVSTDPAKGFSLSVPALGPVPLAFDFSDSIETLKQQYNELETQAHQLADKLKQSTSLSEAERTELQLAVRKSFDARQALQRAELVDLAGRMKSMQQSIDMRDKLVEKIVQKRVDDMMNPNVTWDAGQLSRPSLASQSEDSRNATMLLPKSAAPSIASVPYVPGERPATVIRKRIQGRWIAQTFTVHNSDGLADLAGPLEVIIEGSTMRWMVATWDMLGPVFLADGNASESTQLREDGPLPIDFVFDPNGAHQTRLGIIACDGETLSICLTSLDTTNKDFRPPLFVAGSSVTLIKCRRAEPDAAKAVGLNETDLSTPQTTLDYLHSYSLTHPNEIPAECYTEEALLEMSGVMLQNLTTMSGLSQIGLRTGGMIGSNNDMPIVSGIAASFHLRVDALLKKHSWPTPPELSLNAFALLGKLTLGAALSNEETLLKPDRETFRLAAGILKSPKDFLSEAAKLMDALDENPSNTGSQKEEPKAPPKYEISINGDEATATAIIESDTFSVSTNFKLQRLNERWLVRQVFSE